VNKLITYRYLFIFILSLTVALPFLNRGLFETSEGRYAMVAKTMNDTGNFWIPKINGKEHLTKPPLTYWIIAIGQKIWGMNTLGSRFNHMLLWLMFILIMVRLGELVADKKTGLLAGLIASTSLLPALGSWFLTTDPILVFFQTVAFWAVLEFRQSNQTYWTYIIWLSLALAFNTKGPVALFPLIFWIYFMPRDIRKTFRIPQFLIFILVCSFWYIGLEVGKAGTLARLIQDELIKRTVTNYSGRNAFWWAPLGTYFLPLIIGWGLWPFLINKNDFRVLSKKSQFRLFFWWTMITLIVFSFIQSRLILYILPLVVPVTLLLAESVKRSEHIKRVLALNVILLISFKTFTTIYPYDYNAKQIAELATAKAQDEKVYFLAEDLYGVEFYLGSRFERFNTYDDVFAAFLKNKKIRWVFFQEKRKGMFGQIFSSNSKKILEDHHKGKWNFIKLE
jgi:4-amino-4-deoxy-L-arabinose transferase-like glycosyltransferase